MSYNFLQRKPTQSQAKTPVTGSHQPAAAVGAPRKLQHHNLAPQYPGCGDARPRAFPAPQRRRLCRDTWLPASGAPRAPATPTAGQPRRDPRRSVQPPPRAPGCSDCGAASRNSSTPARPRAPPQPGAGLRDETGSSPPTPAARATTAPSPPPLAVRVGKGATSSRSAADKARAAAAHGGE